jgi:hypothetical protein
VEGGLQGHPDVAGVGGRRRDHALTH